MQGTLSGTATVSAGGTLNLQGGGSRAVTVNFEWDACWIGGYRPAHVRRGAAYATANLTSSGSNQVSIPAYQFGQTRP